MTVNQCFVSVIAPLYNQSQIVESFIAETIEVLRHNYADYELILINDGSEDDTVEKVCSLLQHYECIRLLNLSRHCGTEIAISSGLDAVIGDFIVVMLPDSDPPNLIAEMVNICRQGKEIAIGVRQNRRGEPLWMRIGTAIFYWSCQHIFKIPITKNATQFRVLSRQVVNALIQVQDKYRYLRILSLYVGYRSEVFKYQPIRRGKRIAHRNAIASLNLALQIIFMNSVNPLRFASYLSLLTSLFNLSYMVYIVLVYLFKKKVAEGWVTLSLQNAIAFFFISVILAILCEYVGLMFAKSRGWAAYYIADEKRSSVLIAEPERRNIVQESQKY